ncbi:hypothetical protein [Mycolicibacterium lacusdiani]|jgi:hypothetical protein|nr:hypothetical protein [Mycolicibacterium lacusdiani]
METKSRTPESKLDGVTYVIATVSAFLMFVAVISAAVVYFIGSTLPYAV